MMRRVLMTVAIVVCATACCPTLWIQIYKDNPAPWPAVQLPQVAEVPVLPPPDVPNRFDVLPQQCGEIEKLRVGFPRYTDVFDPRNNIQNARSDAARALVEILSHYHDQPLEGCTRQQATILCTGEPTDADPGCTTLQLTVPVTEPVLARIGNQVYALRDPGADPTTMIQLLKSVSNASSGQQVDVCFYDDLSQSLLSFVHLSDVQIRDPSITLTDRRLSRRLDWFYDLSSFEYDEDLAFYNVYVVEAVIATINKLYTTTSGADRPSFVVHTGDSIDSGTVSELRRFHALIDRLRIPFFELFGNHDVLPFGNLTPTTTHASDKTCTPISALLGSKTWIAPAKLCVDQVVRCPTCITKEESKLVAGTTQDESRKRFINEMQHNDGESVAQPRFPAQGMYCDHPRVKGDAASRFHGFDLGRANDKPDGDMLGYYAFVKQLDMPWQEQPRNALFIALNSEDLEDYQGGTGGRVGHAQLTWLKGLLTCVREHHVHDLVFVMAHQPLSLISVPSEDADPTAPQLTLARILESSPNVVGYLYGHHHEHSICGDRKRPGFCTYFWEIETASLIEFPQEGRLVRIKQIGKRLAFLELTALRERLADGNSDIAHYVDLARRGAERDYCNTKRGKGVRCSADQRPYRMDGHDANARLFFEMPP